MRYPANDPAHRAARASASSRGSALMLALVLAAAPALAQASPPAPAPAPAEPPVTTTPDAVFDISPPPEPPQPEPEPPPPLLLPPSEPPPAEPEPAEPEVEQPPVDIQQIRTLRKAGIGVMAGGGVVALAGMGVTIAFSALGHQAQNAEEPDIVDIENKNSSAAVGGVLVASGIAILAIGGIVFTTAKRRAAKAESARIRVTPSASGLQLQF